MLQSFHPYIYTSASDVAAKVLISKGNNLLYFLFCHKSLFSQKITYSHIVSVYKSDP